jgi:hypothetical protein
VLEVGYWDLHSCAGEPLIGDPGDWHHAAMGVDLLTDRGPSCVLSIGKLAELLAHTI